VRARDATRDQCGVSRHVFVTAAAPAAAPAAPAARRITEKPMFFSVLLKKAFQNKGFCMICPKNILFCNAVFRKTTFLHVFSQFFSLL